MRHPGLRRRARHPLAEIAAARDLGRCEGPLTSIASFYPLLGSNVAAGAVNVPHLPGGHGDAEAVLDRVAAAVADNPADFLVIGPSSARGVRTEDLRRHLR